MTQYAEPNFPAIFRPAQDDLREFDRDLIKELGTWSFILKAILDKGINLDDNIDAAVVSFTSNAVANTEDTVAHTLGKVPSYFVVADIDKGGVVYRGPTAFTKTNVYLKTSTASTAVKVLLL